MFQLETTTILKPIFLLTCMPVAVRFPTVDCPHCPCCALPSLQPSVSVPLYWSRGGDTAHVTVTHHVHLLRACHLPVLFSLSDCLETSTALNFQDTRPSWFPVSHWLILPFLLRWLLLNKFQTWMKKSSVCLSFLSPSSPSGSSHLFFRNFSTIFIQDHLHTCVNLDSLTFGFLPHDR